MVNVPKRQNGSKLSSLFIVISNLYIFILLWKLKGDVWQNDSLSHHSLSPHCFCTIKGNGDLGCRSAKHFMFY